MNNKLPPLLGHASIDHHHEELYALTSQLDRALELHSIDEIESILCFLENYVEDHFLEEENYMEERKFHGLDYHRDEHAIFKTKVMVLRKRFDRKDSITHLVFQIRNIIDDLIDHILVIDSLIPSKGASL